MPASPTEILLPGGVAMPALGLGTWRMGEQASRRAREADALRLGLSLGLKLIDTAEMYGEGGAELVVGDAIAGLREQVFVVSKLYPHNAGRQSARTACARSLQRLRTDHLDVYLLHWRGEVALAETVVAFESLRGEGRIRSWGVSNFDTRDMHDLLRVPGGEHCAVNQVLYHLGCRGIEHDLRPLCRAQGIAIMAYSPLGQGRLLRHRGLKAFAAQHGATPAQIALAWLRAQDGVASIPKAADPAHLRELCAAAAVPMTPSMLDALDGMFPPPSGPTPLAML